MLCYHLEQKGVIKNDEYSHKNSFTISWERNKWRYYFKGNYLSFFF